MLDALTFNGSNCSIGTATGTVITSIDATLGTYHVPVRMSGVGTEECLGYVSVAVIGPNIEFQAVPEEDDLDPGGFLCVNDDDDDDSGTPDLQQFPMVDNEDDLRRVTLSINGYDLAGTVRLNHQLGFGKIRVFHDLSGGGNPPQLVELTSFPIDWGPGQFTNPTILYVEGVVQSTIPRDVGMLLRYTAPDGSSCTDRIFMTVGCDMEITEQRTGEVTETIYLLPGDRESFEIDGCHDSGYVYTISDPTVAKFVVDEELVDYVSVDAPPEVLEIISLKEGEADLELRPGSETGVVRCSVPIKVGGSIIFDFDRLPTYTPADEVTQGECSLALRGGEPPDPVTTDFQLDNLTIPGEPTQPMIVSPEAMAALQAQSPLANTVANFRVSILNADGLPMEQMDVVVIQIPRNPSDPLANEIAFTQQDTQTDVNGQVEGTMQLAATCLDAEDPSWKLLVLVGHRAGTYTQGQTDPFVIEDIWSSSLLSVDDHVSNGRYFRIRRDEFADGSGSVEAALGLELPHVSNRFERIFTDFFENVLNRLPVTVDPNVNVPAFPAGQEWRMESLVTDGTIVIEDPYWTLPLNRDIFLPDNERPIDAFAALYPDDPISDLMRELSGLRYQPALPDPLDPLGFWATVDSAHPYAIVAGHLVFEIVLSFAPLIGDGRDIITEIWNYWNGEDVDGLVFSLALAGLGSDIGTYSGVLTAAAAPANFVAAVTKALLKNPALRPVIRAAVTAGGGGIRGLRMVGRYVLKFTSHFETAADYVNPAKLYEALTNLVRQMFRVNDSPFLVGLPDSQIANISGETIEFLSRRTRAFTDDSAEGLAFLVKRGKKQLVEELLGEFSEEIVEHTLENVAVLARRGITDLSDEATRGLAVAYDAVGGGGSAVVREFVEGSVVTAARADLSLSNVNRLQGVNGLDKMVTHLKKGRDNTDGIDGIVFEGTVARRILDGQVPGSGVLDEVTADGLKSANKIDTLTESWAIQIKHKTTVPPNYGVAQLGGQGAAEAYLNQLVAQAASSNIQRTPLFITNCPITSGFQDMLTQRGILWQQVAP